MPSIRNSSDDWQESAYLVGLIIVFYFILNIFKNYRLALPPGPIGLPIVGYLPFLGNQPYKTLQKLSKKYGNTFSLYLGRKLVVILGDYEAVKDGLSQSATIDRPEHLFSFLPGGVGLSSVNGEEWTEQRRYTMRAMRDLGIGKGAWESIIQEEVRDLMKILMKHNGKPFDVSELLTSSVSNNISSLVLGRTLTNDSPDRKFLNQSINAVSQFFSQSGVTRFFPELENFFVKFGICNYDKWKAKMVAFNDYIKAEIRSRQMYFEDEASENFIDGYLSEMKVKQDKNEDSTLNEVNLCGNVKALIVGGSDTTAQSLKWLLLAMAEYQEVQQRVQQELDDVLGTGQVPNWEDRTKLPYTYAVIMECQRWRTIAPLNTARIAQKKITICGYHVPKGTTIIANNFGLHNDVRYWDQPEIFKPERFINPDGTIESKPQSYVPFSYGKRNCPGETVAMMEILIYFCALLSAFHVSSGEEDGKPKLYGFLGLTYQPLSQKIRLSSRS